MAQETHVLEAKGELGLVLPKEVFPKGDASRRILENRELCQEYHALCATSAVTRNEQWKLTKMKAEAVIQPKKPTHSEDVTHGGGGTWRLHQLDPLLLCDRVFQLPSDLKSAPVVSF